MAILRSNSGHVLSRRVLVPCRRVGAFTLIEMLAVLIVVVALATVAVGTSSRFVDEGRYNTTRLTLERFDTAIIGEYALRGPDGQPLVDGFVADMGRLPVAMDMDAGAEVTLAPAELWDGTGMPNFSFRVALDDPEIRLACGWRGPYLAIGPVATVSYDGWGRPWELLQPTGSAADTEGDSIGAIRSLGQDGEAGGDGYAADVSLTIQDGGSDPARHLSTLHLTIDDPDSLVALATDGVIRVYYPDPENDTLAYREEAFTAEALGGSRIAEVSLADIPIGPRVVRAYYPTAGAESTARSIPLTLTFRKSDETTTVDLEAWAP